MTPAKGHDFGIEPSRPCKGERKDQEVAPAKGQDFHTAPRITRRHFLQLAGAGVASLMAGPRLASATAYRVGVGKQAADPYDATQRAVAACQEWPAADLAGRTVVIKPNLVMASGPETGMTTDPEVVRALVDLALQAGAAQVLIVEGGPGEARFSECGYDFFSSYDPDGRVALVDLGNELVTLAWVPGNGMAYKRMYMAQLLLADDVFFISAAKLKTHLSAHATLAMKNLFGLAPPEHYAVPPDEWRMALHDRSISQVIVDLNMVRPIDFAVIDGVIGMEGDGPVSGTPVEMGIVIAGRNPVAVDRTGVWAMMLPQLGVQHLTYAARKGLGPSDMSAITVLGDPFLPQPFHWPTDLPPLVQHPRAFPYAFAPGIGQRTRIIYRVPIPCQTLVEIIKTSDLWPEVTIIRTLHDWESRPAGSETVIWDGRDDAGQIVPPARYTARVQAKYSDEGNVANASGWVRVIQFQ